ncbi:histone deacetylation protein Rxt3-domain-containing protein [Phlyctochytrium arcticum]|nr:histone deacetylation protein Rxt3-domain-containing protein [Phlyctochytrium arcticum]
MNPKKRPLTPDPSGRMPMQRPGGDGGSMGEGSGIGGGRYPPNESLLSLPSFSPVAPSSERFNLPPLSSLTSFASGTGPPPPTSLHSHHGHLRGPGMDSGVSSSSPGNLPSSSAAGAGSSKRIRMDEGMAGDRQRYSSPGGNDDMGRRGSIQGMQELPGISLFAGHDAMIPGGARDGHRGVMSHYGMGNDRPYPSLKALTGDALNDRNRAVPGMSGPYMSNDPNSRFGGGSSSQYTPSLPTSDSGMGNANRMALPPYNASSPVSKLPKPPAATGYKRDVPGSSTGEGIPSAISGIGGGSRHSPPYHSPHSPGVNSVMNSTMPPPSSSSFLNGTVSPFSSGAFGVPPYGSSYYSGVKRMDVDRRERGQSHGGHTHPASSGGSLGSMMDPNAVGAHDQHQQAQSMQHHGSHLSHLALMGDSHMMHGSMAPSHVPQQPHHQQSGPQHYPSSHIHQHQPPSYYSDQHSMHRDSVGSAYSNDDMEGQENQGDDIDTDDLGDPHHRSHGGGDTVSPAEPAETLGHVLNLTGRKADMEKAKEEAKRRRKPGDVAVVSDERLIKLPKNVETKSLAPVLYTGPRVRRPGFMSVDDIELFLLPQFTTSDHYGLIEVRVPAHLLTFRNNIALQLSAVWGTDIYADDSDVVAMAVHTGWYRPVDAPQDNDGDNSDSERGSGMGLGIKQEQPSPIQNTADPLSTSDTAPNMAGTEMKRSSSSISDLSLTDSARNLPNPPTTPLTGDIDPNDDLPDHELIVTLRVLPRLVKYTGSLRNNIDSRGWGTHDGESVRVEKVVLADKGTEPKRGRKAGVQEWISMVKNAGTEAIPVPGRSSISPVEVEMTSGHEVVPEPNRDNVDPINLEATPGPEAVHEPGRESISSGDLDVTLRTEGAVRERDSDISGLPEKNIQSGAESLREPDRSIVGPVEMDVVEKEVKSEIEAVSEATKAKVASEKPEDVAVCEPNQDNSDPAVKNVKLGTNVVQESDRDIAGPGEKEAQSEVAAVTEPAKTKVASEKPADPVPGQSTAPALNQ